MLEIRTWRYFDFAQFHALLAHSATMILAHIQNGELNMNFSFWMGSKCTKSHWTVNTCNGTGATTHPLNSITRPLSPPFVQNYYYHITILCGQLLHCLSSWLLLYATNSISIAFCVKLLRLLFCSMAQFHSHLDRITISLFSLLATEMNRTA